MDEYNAFPSSVGRTAPVIDFKIVDLESGTAVGVGELGEVSLDTSKRLKKLSRFLRS